MEALLPRESCRQLISELQSAILLRVIGVKDLRALEEKDRVLSLALANIFSQPDHRSETISDFILSILEKKCGYKRVVSTTTRPMRSNETEGVDYYYKTKNEFEELIMNDKLIEYRYYDTIQNGENTRWHYGIERKEIDLNS